MRTQSKRSELLLLCLFMSCLLLLFVNGCVTQTERIYPYESRDESVWEELQREFGWQKQATIYETVQPAESFYKRVTQGLTATVSEWFSEEDNRLSEQDIAENRRRFDRKRAAALQRLREQQELNLPSEN